MNEGNGIDIVDWDAAIYRVFHLKWFMELLKTKRNGLVRPSKWDDPFENFFLKSYAEDSDGKRISFESLANDWYGQCWTENKDSDAMWRIYSANKDGIRVSTTIRKLFASFYDTADKKASLKYYIGKVKYRSRADIENFLRKTSFSKIMMGKPTRGFAEMLCIKRLEFDHENEVRLLYCNCNEKASKEVEVFPFDPDTIIDEVALDPRLSKENFDRQKALIRSHPYSFRITQSDLYRITQMTIRL
jgi:hypothetical protein